jgi:Tol biopolymer transport system component
MPSNGHCSYLPGGKWILNDTYPDAQRNQHVYLYNVKGDRRVPLGAFYLPPEYRGEWRCDTHPRFSPDGRSVIIDSAHGGNGRQMYLIDISEIIG